MAVEKKDFPLLPLTTMIDVFAIKGDIVIKETMTYKESLNKKKAPGWIYRSFQIGASSMIATTTKEQYLKTLKLKKL